MTFVGALNEGLTGDRTLIYSKSILDGFTSIVLASVYGVGVLFSALPLFIFQAGLTCWRRSSRRSSPSPHRAAHRRRRRAVWASA